MYVNSPFPEENRLLMVAEDVSSRYTRRSPSEYRKVADYIRIVTQSRPGNYMVFLPSFDYLAKVYKRYVDIYGKDGTIVQGESLSEAQKEEYLAQFSLENKVVGFTVVGGMFSEGVDLPGDKLIGAIIVGVGFPKVSIENNIIQEYFDTNGFDYSYTYPGINKVLQSVGRVIRTETDKGRVLLIDNRYNNPKYRFILPSDWIIEDYKLK